MTPIALPSETWLDAFMDVGRVMAGVLGFAAFLACVACGLFVWSAS